MRVLFVLIVLANMWIYALGQGWIGARPDDAGRERATSTQELDAERVTLRS